MAREDPKLLLFPHNEIVSRCGFPHSGGKITMTAIAMDESPASTGPAWRWIALFLLLLAASLITLIVYGIVYERQAQILISEAEVEAQLQAAVLKSELTKQRSVPVILAMDVDLIKAVRNPSPQHALLISRKLETLQHATNSAVIYVIDKRGRTLSASNYSEPDTFVGQNFSFRRYFSEALKRGGAEQFALGSVSKRPGFYFSRRIDDGADPSGVVVVKIEFDEIEASWRGAFTKTFVTNSTNQILLTSVPDQRFRELPQPSPGTIVTSLPAPVAGWTLTVYSSRKDALKSARAAAPGGQAAPEPPGGARSSRGSRSRRPGRERPVRYAAPGALPRGRRRPWRPRAEGGYRGRRSGCASLVARRPQR